MSDSRRSDEPRDPLLEDLGRWARQRRTNGDAAGYQPLPEAQVEALLDRVLDDEPASDPDEPAAPEPDDGTVVSLAEARPPSAGTARRSWIAGSVAALAAAAAVALVVGRTPEPPSEPTAPGVSAEPVAAPGFGSWRIDGGGARPVHLGTPTPTPEARLCQGRRLRLSFALARGQAVAPSQPLELTLDAQSAQGSDHRDTISVSGHERFSWAGDGRALVFEGDLAQLTALSPGTWTLTPRLGAPGTCQTPPRDGCTSLRAQTIDVVAADGCDDGR